ncbi:MAG: TonB family protein [Paludibacter sp.]
MKKLLILLFVVCFYTISFSANFTIPKYLFRVTNDLELTKVVQNDTATILSFIQYSPNGASLAKNNYIQSTLGGEKYYAKSTIDLPSPMGEKWKVKDKKSVEFSIVFPKIDPSIESINFSEPAMPEGNLPWQIFGIDLKKHVWKSKLPESLEGKWLKTDGSNLLFVTFYEEAAILDAQVWQYESVQTVGKQTEIVLKQKRQSRKLTVEVDDKGNMTVSEKGKNALLCSTQRTKNLLYYPSDKQPFPTDIFKSDSATYCGYIHGFTPLMPKKLKFDFDDAITGRKVNLPIMVSENGYFEIRFALNHPIMASVNLKGIGFERMLVEPGKKTFHCIEFRIKNEKPNEFYGMHHCNFMGDNAELNDEVHAIIGKEENAKKLRELIPDATIYQFSDSLAADYQQELLHLVNFKSERNLSPKAASMILANIEMKRTALLSEFVEIKLKSIVEKNPKTFMQILKTFKKPEMDSVSALSFIESVKQPITMLDFRFNAVFRKLAANNYFIPMRTLMDKRLEIIFDIAKKCKDLTSDEVTLLSELKSIPLENRDSTHLKKYMPEFMRFTTNHTAETKAFVDEIGNDKLLVSANNYFTDTPLMIELIKSNVLFKKFDEFNLLTDEQLKETTNQFSNPFIISKITDANNDLKKKIASSKGNLNILVAPKVKPEKLFEAMMQKYIGRVVYVDFWATWCGPCMRNIAEMKSLKDELKADNVAFVYITNPTSPQNLWGNVIPGISGDHYRLTQSEWDVLSKKFNVVSIPHGMLIDQKGEIVSPKIQGLTNEDVKTMIYSTLGKAVNSTSVDDKIYEESDIKPEFPGGINALMAYIGQNLRYPPTAQKLGIQGKVVVGFVINKKGEVVKVDVLKGVNPDLNQEAIRIINSLPKWTPGVKDSKVVSVHFTLPINFKLQ